MRSTRRRFLANAAAFGAAGIASPWALNLATMGAASAQSTSATDYKALVCIFLAGGNDAHNTVLPTDDAAWWAYETARGAEQAGVSIAIDKSKLLSITPKDAAGLNTGRHFALHPQLKRLQGLFGNGKAAIVANIGPLLRPTNKIDLLDANFPLPKNLYSHNDQQSTWQSFGPEGAVAGWGGRIMDSLMSRNTAPVFSSVGVNTGQVWLAGHQAIPYQLGSAGAYQLGGGTGQVLGSAQVYQSLRHAAGAVPRGDVLGQDYARVVHRALSTETALFNALPPANRAPWGTATASVPALDPLLQYVSTSTNQRTPNPLAMQLQVVARMIEARKHNLVGAKRQVFMVTLGGFDTHSDQINVHQDLLAKLDHAIGYFYDTLASMGVANNVTTFTASDFGRAMSNNGDGTDHGWGAHHFVVGGSVKGGDIYGAFPTYSNHEPDGHYFSANLLTNGVFLPEISVDQLVYTLGRWMDVSVSDLTGAGGTLGIAPNIAEFDLGVRDLGFMS